MSFRVIAGGRRFAIDGELNAAVAREKARLAGAGSGGAGLATKSLTVAKQAVDELLATAPHDCDVKVDLWGERHADGTGRVTIKLTIAAHEAPAVEEKADTEVVGTIGGLEKSAEGAAPETVPGV